MAILTNHGANQTVAVADGTEEAQCLRTTDPDAGVVALESLPIGAALLDAGFAVLAANAPFRRLTEAAGRLMLGRLTGVFPHLAGATAPGWQVAPLVRPDGSAVLIRTRLQKLEPPGYLLLAEEVEDTPGIAQVEARVTAARGRFLSAAGHDLRQPLNALSLFLGVLRVSKSLQRAVDVADQMQVPLDTLIHLFNGMLTLSRFETGAVEARAAPIDTAALMERLLVEHEGAAQQKGLVLKVVPSSVPIAADRDLLLLVARNLIANALFFTDSGGVLIGCRRRGSRLRLDVIDTSAGIAAAELPTIFEELHRRGGQPVEAKNGYGLGLATVRRAADLMGCPVEAASLPGHGTRISVYLPRAG